MRVGTWNMEGHSGKDHVAFLTEQACDVLLLTEVKDNLKLDEYEIAASSAEMTKGKRWAAVAAKKPLALVECDVPHAASVAGWIGSTMFVSSILPWRSCGGGYPWKGADHATRMVNTLTGLKPFLEEHQGGLVWGGDWNQSLAGDEWAGSKTGRQALLALVGELGLTVPTAGLSHRSGACLSIDHIAIVGGAREARRVDTPGLSDHDFYMIVTDDD